MKRFPSALAVVAALLLTMQNAQADEACTGFKWDVAREHALFLGAATAAAAGNSVQTAAPVALDRLYELALQPQPGVTFAVPPSKKMLADGAHAGLVRFRVPQSGLYRVSLGVPFWIDIAAAGQALASVDFNGSPGCDTPRKVVVYPLPAGQDLTLQFSGNVEPSVRVTLTAVAAPAQ